MSAFRNALPLSAIAAFLILSGCRQLDVASDSATMTPEEPQTIPFPERHSPAAVRSLAMELLAMLDPGSPLHEPVQAAVRDGRHREALDIFQNGFLSTLRAQDFQIKGLPVPALEKGTAAADALLNDSLTLASEEIVPLGVAGTRNWNLEAPALWHPTSFDPLLEQYVATGNPLHLGKWVEYLDDWAINGSGFKDSFETVCCWCRRHPESATGWLWAWRAAPSMARPSPVSPAISSSPLTRPNATTLQGCRRSSGTAWHPGWNSPGRDWSADRYRLSGSATTKAGKARSPSVCGGGRAWFALTPTHIPTHPLHKDKIEV